ncbi:MAG: disulfide bond formation protein B [Pseudomonadota bacterium]
MTQLTPRLLNFGGFTACAAMMAYALYAEYVLYLMPCPLCTFQRLGVIVLGVVFLLAALHNPAGWGRRVYAGVVVLATAGAAGVAGYHVWMQGLPEDEVPTCGPGLSYMMETLPLLDVVKQVFQGSGSCATISWEFLGLSMPTWVMINVVLLGILGLWANLKRAPAHSTDAILD